ncbi:hypothetical protein [Veillonella sp. VA142]|uniref:hypothetical protein n=1 Tax=Veillonella sp. VA142 TaxID=741834 RepID=UPI000F8DE1D1|nr:hypothetical protein [Veillonella sp. VA142]
MKLVERITAVVKEIGKDIKALKGRVSTLETNGTGGTVDESVITNKVSEEIAKVVGGAPATFDTLKEISDYIETDKTGASAMAESINNRLRFDEQQTLTENQQANALGALGLTDTDFVSVYNTAVNG